MERRLFGGSGLKIETRADGKSAIVGHAAVFYREGDTKTEFRLLPNVVERVKPSAFARALAEKQDVRGLFNHDPNHVLGRTAAGTMRLSADEHGLKYEIDVPDTQIARDMAESIRRGDITGSSFSFSVPKGGDNFDSRGGVRWLNDVNLFDVGPVTMPAYEGTSAGLRCVSDDGTIDRELEELEREQSRREVDVRLRLLEIDS